MATTIENENSKLREVVKTLSKENSSLKVENYNLHAFIAQNDFAPKVDSSSQMLIRGILSGTNSKLGESFTLSDLHNSNIIKPSALLNPEYDHLPSLRMGSFLNCHEVIGVSSNSTKDMTGLQQLDDEGDEKML